MQKNTYQRERDPMKFNRLMQAARDGSTKSIERLLGQPDCGSLVGDEHGTTALMWAAQRGHDNCVELLLPHSDAWLKTISGTRL